MSTYFPSGKNLEASRKWFIVDATDVTVGRLASQVAHILMGKAKPTYTPFIDVGDHVIVINAEKVALSGNKWQDKMYRHHTGYPGGLKEEKAGHLIQRRPERLLELAVQGMLPKTRIGRAMVSKLKVYAGPDHPHQAQQPEHMKIVAQPVRQRR